MPTILNDVRPVGFLQNLKGDARSPESFAFPACLTSLMEFLGEDPRWETITAHNREWSKRRLNDAILAATGMGFGLLWHKDNCPSCHDLMQVNDHDETIELAFGYVGYEYEIIKKTDGNYGKLKRRIVESIDAGRPVLAFGAIGPPECSIICGYDLGGDTLLGWSHFQSYDKKICAPNGMFRIINWHRNLTKIVLCGVKKEPVTDLKEIARRGLAVANAKQLSGYYAGAAAYDAWVGYVTDPAYKKMKKKVLKQKYGLHHGIVGNHAEARCYLGGFLREAAGDDARLHSIAEIYGEIHDTCWKVWEVAGGLHKKTAWKIFRNRFVQAKIAEILREIQALDEKAARELQAWLGE